MTLALDRRPAVVTQGLREQIIEAKRHLPNDSRAELMVGTLSRKEEPLGLEGQTRVYEFDSLGLRRIYARTRKGRLHEYFPIGPVNNDQRIEIAKAFGYNPDQQIRLIVNDPNPYKVKKEYYISK